MFVRLWYFDFKSSPKLAILSVVMLNLIILYNSLLSFTSGIDCPNLIEMTIKITFA